MSVAWVGAGIAAYSAYSSSQAAGDAADAQAQSARDANQTQMQMYNQSRQDQLPWLDRGNQAGNRLQYLLGLSPTGSSLGGSSSSSSMMYAGGAPNFNEAGSMANPATGQMNRDQLRAQLLPEFTKRASSSTGVLGNGIVDHGYYDPTSQTWLPILTMDTAGNQSGQSNNGQSTIDEVGLNAAIDAQLAKYQQQQQAEQNAQNDPAYGSLMRDFTKQDMENDPVYSSGFQFGLDEGQKALDRQAAASGNLLSGAAAKAMSKFANDYASTKGNESFNRWNVQGANKFNRLASIAGVGQTAANQTGAAAMQTGNQIAQNQIGVGNARAASAIGSANAWSGGLSNAYNNYQSNQLMNRLFTGGSNGAGSGYNPYAGYDSAANGGWGIE